MTRAHVLGFPRIGAQRELKAALESFWRGESDEAALCATGAELRRRHWQLQQDAGLDLLAAGDFAYYDTMLDMTVRLGAVPRRFGFDTQAPALSQAFELARGNAAQPAMEMTKWFDTNYHYLVPELDAGMRFEGSAGELLGHLAEAQALGSAVKPVLVGPLTWLALGKPRGAPFDRLTLLPALLEAYLRILRTLAARGVEWVQVDEPAFCLQLDDPWWDAAQQAYEQLSRQGVKLLLATYFEAPDRIDAVARLPVHGFHVDLVRSPRQLGAWRSLLPDGAVLSAGVVDGRNVWRCDLRAALGHLRPLHDQLGERLWVAPSCSLQHVPVSLAQETALPAGVSGWLAFATEKLGEVVALSRALDHGEAAAADALAASDAALASRRQSRLVTKQVVQRRMQAIAPSMTERQSPFPRRNAVQRAALALPPLPTTTIGSFPQTPAIRRARRAFRQNEIGALEYLGRMRAEIRHAVQQQEALGLDVLVHGEPERNDMVEYFGEQLWGFAVTAHGWVQSYGSRCVKPPILYGDVFRPEPMTVETAQYAQSITDKPVKGMLTGPVTMLQWSFVRDDQPRETTALQLALALRDEVLDLERAGIRVIQIDEPALREGLPLKRRDWPHYLSWAVRAFKLACGGVSDATQVHTHMCYSEFADILPAVVELDADVITIETARSAMELLDAFGEFRYPNDIGPGVYDIHSPRVPSAEAMQRLLERACEVIPPERLWVNPDCGLKTRDWPEVMDALRRMVQAARTMRARLEATLPAGRGR
jgi:5-methyltetrahydropteroyltriglutamate--homocysteine methyltransferase